MTTDNSVQPATLDGNAMATSPWIVTLFRVSDSDVQQVILDTLKDVDDLVALGRLIGHDAYIAVETMDAAPATAARTLIMAIDPDARVLDTARRHPDPGSRASRPIGLGLA